MRFVEHYFYEAINENIKQPNKIFDYVRQRLIDNLNGRRSKGWI